jgi:hypothetical protein
MEANPPLDVQQQKTLTNLKCVNLKDMDHFKLPLLQKHKEANLRLVAESSRHQHQALTAAGSPSASDPRTVLEEELERKILENGELHSKVSVLKLFITSKLEIADF